MKTADLTGPALDWAVAKCVDAMLGIDSATPSDVRYSTDWSQGGPIIEREKIWLKFPFSEVGEVEAIHGSFGFPNIVSAKGPTPLIAAMRCYVASKLGDEIVIPSGL